MTHHRGPAQSRRPIMGHLKTLLFALYISSATIELVCATANHTNYNSTNAIDRPIGWINRLVVAQAPYAATFAPTNASNSSRTTTTTLRPTSNATTTSTAANLNQDRNAEASLLRPSFIWGLLGSHKRPGGGGKQAEAEDEMEEVTQTIMVPIRQSEQGQTNGNKMIKSLKFGASDSSVPSQIRPDELRTTNPLAEASFRLTSTEMGGLLNDREAPEFYREREQNGDGIMVGEEPASRLGASSSVSGATSRLGMAASGPFGSQFMGDYGPSSGAGFDGGDSAAAIYRQRLAQAASEDAYGGGFNHRFGQQSFGGGSFGGSGGGLMQSPNEYSEVNSFGGGGSGGFMGGGGYGGSEYSPNSGLLRAGSEGAGFGGGSFGSAGMIGASGPLEAAAAGGFGGGGEFGGAGMSEFGGSQGGFYGEGGGGSGRLQAHASYNPYMAAAGDADYASRFGYPGSGMGGGGGSFGMDQRGFASQNSHQIMSQRLQGAASGGRGPGGRLMPLTPVIPLADELGGMQPNVMSSNQRDQVAQGPSQMMRSQQMMSGSSGGGRGSQVHEALEEDPTDVSQADDGPGSGEQSYGGGYDGSPGSYGSGGGDGSGTGPDMSGMVATTMSSNQRDQYAGGAKVTGYKPSFVLNVPPPNEQSASMAMPGFAQRGQRGLSQQQMVEFSRVGSAGYMGPTLSQEQSASQQAGRSMFVKKFGQQYQVAGGAPNGEQEQSSEENEESSSEESPSSSSSGADNPAHAGKYIID